MLLEDSLPNGNVEIRFGCLLQEWTQSYAEAKSCDDWDAPPEDRGHKDEWEYMHCQGWTRRIPSAHWWSSQAGATTTC